MEDGAPEGGNTRETGAPREERDREGEEDGDFESQFRQRKRRRKEREKEERERAEDLEKTDDTIGPKGVGERTGKASIISRGKDVSKKMAQLSIASLSRRKEKRERERQQKEKNSSTETEKRQERHGEKEKSITEKHLRMNPSTSGLVPLGKRKERS